MVKSQTTSITPAQHADNHRTGGIDPLTGDVGINDLKDYTVEDTTKVYDANAPANMATLDLSGVVGSNLAAVILRIVNTSGNAQRIYYTHGGVSPTQSPAFWYDILAGQTLHLGVIMTNSTGLINWKGGITTNHVDIYVCQYKVL